MTNPHKEIVNGHKFRMFFVERGTFDMGCTAEQGSDCESEEKPQHQVTLSGFYIGKFPVTQALWKAVMNGKNPSRFKSPRRPVENVSWDDAQVFIKKLNEMPESGRPENHFYRLPTEAEWEYAARGGNMSKGYKYAGSNNVGDVAWYNENSKSQTHPVGTKISNELGLFDMSGNVWEWCEDDWHGDYKGAPADGRAWVDTPNRAPLRVNRGGSWGTDAQDCRAAYRNSTTPGYRGNIIGFRLALSLQLTGKPDGVH